jgi:hypothetical protein
MLQGDLHHAFVASTLLQIDLASERRCLIPGLQILEMN